MLVKNSKRARGRSPRSPCISYRFPLFIGEYSTIEASDAATNVCIGQSSSILAAGCGSTPINPPAIIRMYTSHHRHLLLCTSPSIPSPPGSLLLPTSSFDASVSSWPIAVAYQAFTITFTHPDPPARCYQENQSILKACLAWQGYTFPRLSAGFLPVVGRVSRIFRATFLTLLYPSSDPTYPTSCTTLGTVAYQAKHQHCRCHDHQHLASSSHDRPHQRGMSWQCFECPMLDRT